MHTGAQWLRVGLAIRRQLGWTLGAPQPTNQAVHRFEVNKSAPTLQSMMATVNGGSDGEEMSNAVIVS